MLFGWLLPIYRFASMNGTGESALVNCGISARMIGNYGDCMQFHCKVARKDLGLPQRAHRHRETDAYK